MKPFGDVPWWERKVLQHDLPAPWNTVTRLKLQRSPLAELACLGANDIRQQLQLQWSFKDLPHLTHLANAILELPLSCLLEWGDEYWLTFNASSFPISISGTNEIPRSLYEAFPIRSVGG